MRGRSVRPGALLAGLTATPQAVLMFLCVLRTGKALVDLSAGPYSGILLFVLWVFAFGNAVLAWIYIVCTAFLCAVVVYATGLDAAAGLTPDRDYVRWLPAEALFTAVNAATGGDCLLSAVRSRTRAAAFLCFGVFDAGRHRTARAFGNAFSACRSCEKTPGQACGVNGR